MATLDNQPSPALWLVDPGPPDGPWPPLYPFGYPAEVTALPRANDTILPDGAPFTPDDLAECLAGRRWGSLVYFGHIGTKSDLPAGVGLVFSGPTGPELLTAHAWLRDPARWPAPPRVALLGCGSDDSGALEQSGLMAAALNAGASVVIGTRWPLANTPGAIRLLQATSTALAEPSVVDAIRRWQCAELDLWRSTGDPSSSPLYWSSPVTYDKTLLLSDPHIQKEPTP